jgi:hypothetical protein
VVFGLRQVTRAAEALELHGYDLAQAVQVAPPD